MDTYVLPLDHEQATLATTGGKGASLARLAAAGLPVPPGFHITTAAYRRFVAEHGLQEQILAVIAAAAPDRLATLEEASGRIGQLFAQHAMPDDITEAIRQAYARLGGGDVPVAVRSSATAEDLPEASFAGQQETYLNMRGADAVLDAVKRCWTSLWTARAIAYRARQGIDPASVALAVVVQELVFADAAGVAWTPLFALASAVVTDIGGSLSHSSIVAREYGIPAVMGTGMATRRIRSGQTVTVDGDAGTVQVL